MPSSIPQLTQQIYDNHGLYVRSAAEIECYLKDGDPEKDALLLAMIMTACHKQDCNIRVEHETGERQYEFVTSIHTNPIDTVRQVQLLKTIAHDIATQQGFTFLFDAKPFDDQPGCGLHIHISLEDAAGNHPFKKAINAADENPILLHAIGGLCETMCASMIHFAPQEASYLRITEALNPPCEEQPMRQHNHAPTHVSWGGNNRTTAIRIPASTIDPEQRHIEHRVAGSDADAEMVMRCVLHGIDYGMTHQIDPGPKIWGNASDPQYALQALPRSLQEAQHYQSPIDAS